LSSVYRHALEAAQAAECAGDQGKLNGEKVDGQLRAIERAIEAASGTRSTE
jgi:hypothetical protein